MKRRHFLEFAATTLATIGLSPASFQHSGDQMGRVLAQSTPRKLALLVGINQYPKGIRSLRGCATDVQLQRELLIHRFGFKAQDILVLQPETLQPTRQNIIQAFEEHLIQQAKPGDVVVFHFSGHGGRVRDPKPISEDGLNGVIVPIDYQITNNDGDRNLQTSVNSIMGRSLFLLTAALKTENFTAVLDCCHSGGASRKAETAIDQTVLRSIFRDNLAAPNPSEAELADQDRWMQAMGWTTAELQQRRQQGIAKGVMLGSAQRNQFSADVSFGDFYAGAFTYLLTRYLWQATSDQTLGNVFIDLGRSTKDLAKTSRIVQDPIFETKPGSNYQQQPIYLINPSQPAAEAVVQSVQGDRVEFWLGGISPESLDAFSKNAKFAIVNSTGQALGYIRQRGRTGLVGYGTLEGAPKSAIVPGALLQEQVRGIAIETALRIGVTPAVTDNLQQLKNNLVNTRRIPAQRLELVSYRPDQAVDYILHRNNQGQLELNTTDLKILPNGLAAGGSELERLAQRLQSLLAVKVLKTLTNGNSSTLKVTVEVLDRKRETLVSATESRGAGNRQQRRSAPVKAVKAGSEIALKLINQDRQPLHVAVLAIASNGDLTILHPLLWDGSQKPVPLAPQEHRMVPASNDRFQFMIEPPAGFLELITLASTEPLNDVLRGLQKIAQQRGTRSGSPLDLQNGEPLAIVGDLLNTLDRDSQRNQQAIAQVAVDQFAMLSTILEVQE
ncbi:MAG: hypothetical protein B0A82_03180 [Alkalinema sp. CACIAM 70d]|nr:MAG: hypothetical protein B0A82_03180 [Alkalinema sp. CACIAM 70d]